MIKEVDPFLIGALGVITIGIGITQANPDTRALMERRSAAEMFQSAATIEARAMDAAKTITEARQACTPVAQVSDQVLYSFPAGTVICDGRSTATLDRAGRATVIVGVAQ